VTSGLSQQYQKVYFSATSLTWSNSEKWSINRVDVVSSELCGDKKRLRVVSSV